MAPQTPVLLVDNLFDTDVLYPSAVVSASTEATDHEAYHVADYRRDRSNWIPTSDAADHWLQVDLGAGVTASPDTVFLDRGHNLWGRTLYLEGSADGVTWDVAPAALVVPASGTVGGGPAWPTLTVTEEGALYAFLTPGALAARRFWRLRLVHAAGFYPVVTGLLVGTRVQLLGYSSTFDEDAGGRVETSETSRFGYRATDYTVSWRTCELALSLIGATEYDSTMRALRQQLFEQNQPAVVCLDYGTRPERAWMYQYDGARWAMAKSRVYRGGRITLRELMPKVR